MNETELGNLIIRLVGDATNYLKMISQSTAATAAATKAISEQMSTIEGFKNILEGYASSLLGLLGKIGAGFTAMGAFIKFEQGETEMIRLKAAIEASGHSVSAAVENYRNFAAEMAKTTMLSKGAAIALLKQGEAMGLSNEKTKRATEDAAALAALKGGEPSQYMRVAVAVQQGNYMMARYTLGLRGVHKESEIHAAYLRQVAAGHRANNEIMKTGTAQLEKVKQEMVSMIKEVGGMIATVLVPIIEVASALVKMFKELNTATNGWLLQIIAVLAVVRPLGAGLDFLARMGPAVLNGILAVNTATTSATSALNLATAAAKQFGVAWAALAVFAGVKLVINLPDIIRGKKITALRAETEKELDEIVQRSTEKSAKASAEWTRQIQELPIQERKTALETAAQAAEEEAAKIEGKIAALTKRIEEAKGKAVTDEKGRVIGWKEGKPLQGDEEESIRRYTKMLKGWEDAAADMRRQMEDIGPTQKAREEFDRLRESTEKQIATFGLGKTALQMYKFELEGISFLERFMLEARMNLLESMRAETEETKKAADATAHLHDEQTGMVNKLAEGVQAFGLTGAALELAKMRMKGFSEEELELQRRTAGVAEQQSRLKKLFEEGMQVEEEFKDPVAKTGERIEDLNQMLKYNAIGWDTYRKAIMGAKEEALKLVAATQKVEYSQYGSLKATKEARQELERQRMGLALEKKFGVVTKAPTGPVDINIPVFDRKADKMIEILGEIRDATENLAGEDSPLLPVPGWAPANLEG